MGVPGSANPLLLRSAGVTQYQVSRSLRFNAPDSSFLSRTPASAGNRKTWTWAGWVKRSGLTGALQKIFTAGSSGSAHTGFQITGGEQLEIFHFAGSYVFQLITTQVFRDVSAWFHLHVTVDTSQSTSTDRVKLYVNGSQVTTFSTATYPALNADYEINNTSIHAIAKASIPAESAYFSGYLAEIHFIDGQALTPSSFTEVSATTGQLVPKAYTGTYGTNGFKLTFSDNSATTATTLGKDSAGSNNWTPNNFSITAGNGNYVTGWSGSLIPAGSLPYEGGPLAGFDGNKGKYAVASTGGATATWTGSVSFTSSLKLWYYMDTAAVTYKVYGANSTFTITTPGSWSTQQSIDVSSIGSPLTKIEITSSGSNSGGFSAIERDGVILVDYRLGSGNDSLVDTPTSYGTGESGGDVRGNYATLNPLAGTVGTLSNGNLDCSTSATISHRRSTFGMTSGKWYWECTPNSSSDLLIGIVNNNATFSGNASYPGGNADGWSYYQNNGSKYNNGGSAYGASYTTGDIIGVAFDADAGTLTFYKNGTSQGQAFSGLTSGPYFAAVGNGATADRSYSMNFGQRPFAYPVSGFKALCDTNLTAPVIAKPNTVMDVKLITANNSTQVITGLAFSPDLVWTKSRSNAFSHYLYDTVRGVQKPLISNATNAEATITTSLTSFNSDGFTLGADDGANYSSGSGVAWTWDAGTSTVTNTQGSITSSVRANASAGFSVVRVSPGSNGQVTIGHGLGVAPGLILMKATSAISNWHVWHSTFTTSEYLFLDSTAAKGTSTNLWGTSLPSSTTFGFNIFAATWIAYCFAPVAGYSSFGSYTGNGSADGPFVFTGMRTRWVLIKNTGAGGNVWVIYDTARDTYNIAGTELYPNLSSAEAAGTAALDIVSNGFKIRTTSGGLNANGAVYIYAAFAENPFQYARAR